MLLGLGSLVHMSFFETVSTGHVVVIAYASIHRRRNNWREEWFLWAQKRRILTWLMSLRPVHK
jgi:hypothetical protein